MALSAQGVTFTILDLTEGTRVARAIGGMISFAGLDGTSTDKDRTTLASTAREYAGGLRDGGKFSIELFRLPDDIGQATALLLQQGQNSTTAVLTFAGTGAPICTFPAYIKSITSGGERDSDHKGTLTIKVAGKPVWS